MQIGTALSQVIAARGIRKADISRRTGLSDSYLSQLLSGKIKDPSARAVYLICRALGVSVDGVLQLADDIGDEFDECKLAGNRVWNDELAIKVHAADTGKRETLRKAVQLTDNPTAEIFIDVIDDLLTYVKRGSKEIEA